MATNTFDYFNKLAGGSSAPISLNGNVPVVTPQVPATGAVGGVPALDPLSTLLAGLLAPQGQKQGGLDFGAVLQHLFPGDPVGEQNRLSGPGGKLSPFTTGFFKTDAERQQVAADRGAIGGGYGAVPNPSVTLPFMTPADQFTTALRYGSKLARK